MFVRMQALSGIEQHTCTERSIIVQFSCDLFGHFILEIFSPKLSHDPSLSELEENYT